MTDEELRFAALRAHRQGIGWPEFWRSVSSERGAVLHYEELLHLVVSGDRSGMYSPGDEDVMEPVAPIPSPHDTHTEARLQKPLPGM